LLKLEDKIALILFHSGSNNGYIVYIDYPAYTLKSVHLIELKGGNYIPTYFNPKVYENKIYMNFNSQLVPFREQDTKFYLYFEEFEFSEISDPLGSAIIAFTIDSN